MPGMLDGKTIIVTGAAGNLGRVTVAHLLAEGAKVTAFDRPGAMLDALPAHPRLAKVALADLADEAASSAAIAGVIGAHGGLHGVAHTVGGFAWAGLADSPAALWEQQFRLNVLTTLNVLRTAATHMRAHGGGSIVAVGAGAAQRAPAGMSAYAAAKSAVHRMVESFADELKGEGVRVNAVLPGTMDTAQNRTDMPDADPTKWTRTEEVAATIGFLLSDAGSGITGVLVPVPGRG
ncbi:MAG: SDR family NAD(P)-dependent oxidoreductase [Alphaproteobacteria bacterium]|nr:SDR family NAD(P)-dependent oxidoreductase [Alphaproteobacteria bacterium]